MSRLPFPRLSLLLAGLVCVSGLSAQTSPTTGPYVLEVGGRPVKVPPPAGFVRCDGINKEWDKAMSSLLPVSNRMLATFGTAEDQELLRKNTPSDYERNFNIQTLRTTENMEIGERTFSGLRSEMKKGLEDMQTKLEGELKKLAGQGNKYMQDAHNVDLALKISDTAMLGFFEDTASSLGFSMAIKMGMTGADGKREESRAVGACLMLPVNGRLVMLYSTAPYTGQTAQIEAETTVKSWRDSILAVNPRVAGPAAGFDWEKVGQSTAIGAGIGLVIGLLAWIGKKFKRPQAS